MCDLVSIRCLPTELRGQDVRRSTIMHLHLDIIHLAKLSGIERTRPSSTSAGLAFLRSHRFDSHCGWTKFPTSPVWFSLRVAH